jgi:GntR family transcriptional regulator
MQFREQQAIYLQIADYVRDKILSKQWAPGDRVPSVRDLGMDLQVNPNTVVRSYDILEQEQTIFNRRGLGYFVAENAEENIRSVRREQFRKETLPQLIQTMRLLHIPLQEIVDLYEKHQQ